MAPACFCREEDKMSQRSAVTAVIGVALWVVSFPGPTFCASPKPTETQSHALKAQGAGVVATNNRFAFDLYRRLRSEKGNLFFSPASISMALAMTYIGAAENTEAQMAKVLHLGMPKAQLNEEMRALRTSWSTNEKKQRLQLDVANRL